MRPPLRGWLVDANLGIIGFPANLAKNYNLSAYALIRIGRWSDAEEAFETGTPIWQGLAKRSKGLEKYLPDSLQRYGWALWRAGRPTPAVAAYGRERAIRQRLCAAEPKNTSYRDALANSATYTAAALVTLGRLAEARACCDRAIMAREDLVKADPRDESFIQGLAESLMRSASVRSASGDAAGAAADGRRAASLYASHPPLRPRSEIFRACCHGLLSGLAGKAGSGIPAAEGISQADEAMVILHQAFAGGYRDPNHLRMEPGLDPLRTRDDFWLLLMDQSFPPEPFAP